MIVRHRGDITEQQAMAKFLIAKDSRSKAVFAHAVEKKGPGHDGYAVDCLVKDLRWLGYDHVILKSDQEPAIMKLLSTAPKTFRITCAEEGERGIMQEEHPTTYDHQANGLVESAVKAVTNKMLTLKRCLEESLHKTMPIEHPLLHRLAEFAARHITTCHVSADGRTPY